MKIAVVGSWKEHDSAKWGLKGREAFPRACQQIGNAVIRLGHTLVIGSESEDTADRYAVEGAIQAAGGATPAHPRIIIIRPNDQHIAFEEMRRQNPGLFSTRVSLDSGWNVTKLLQVNAADGVIVVGGADFSYQAGLAAVLCKKLLVPVGSFGGAAKRLLNVLASSRSSWPGDLPSEDDLGLLHGGWDQFLLDKTVALLGLSRLPTLLIIHGRSNDKVILKNYLQNQLGLPQPLIMGEQPADGSTLPEKFEKIAKKCDGAIALVTPDDRSSLANGPSTNAQEELQARQNVWLEVGWFWGALGLRRFRLLRQKDTVIPNDLQGLEYLQYESTPLERGDEVRRFTESLRGSLHS